MTNRTERSPRAVHAPIRRVVGEAPPELASLRARRRQLKQTQEETAAAVSVSLSTYQRWERGEQTPNLRGQRRLAAHLNVPFTALDRWFPTDDHSASPTTDR
jgi:transcriptional regulator with XRE-family HTH domain